MSGKESGWALLAVLWVLTFLAMMAAAIAALETTTARLDRRALDDIRLEADISAGLAHAILAISDTRSERHWPVDGRSETLTLDGDPIRIAVQSEAGLVDLNAADATTLSKLLRAGGMDAASADEVAQRIVDWRTEPEDFNDQKAQSENQESIARDSDYESSGRNYKPRHGPFQSVSELKLVLGMTPDLYARIAPAITVYSRSADVDTSVAPEIVKNALAPPQDNNAAQPAAIAPSQPGLPADSAPSNSLASTVGQSYAITLTAAHRGHRMTRTIIVAITGSPGRPYLIQAWQ